MPQKRGQFNTCTRPQTRLLSPTPPPHPYCCTANLVCPRSHCIGAVAVLGMVYSTGTTGAGAVSFTAAAAAESTLLHTLTTAGASHAAHPALQDALHSLWGTTTTASCVIAAGVNVAVLGYVGYKLYRNAAVQYEKLKQLRRADKRLWQLATQGAEAAGPVPEDLGQPDAAGVYTQQSATGGLLYFRQVQQHPFAAPHWEWSRDKVLWIPTAYADSLWCSTDSSPSTADVVLIRRLEVEGQLLARSLAGSNGGCSGSSGGGCGSSAAAMAGALLPPLDLSLCKRDITSLVDVPTAFVCPISMRVMTQPVVTPSGATFDRPALIDWIRQTHTDPLSGQPLTSDQLVPNLVLRDMIHAFLQEPQPVNADNSSSNNSSGNGSGSSSGGSRGSGGSAAVQRRASRSLSRSVTVDANDLVVTARSPSAALAATRSPSAALAATCSNSSAVVDSARVVSAAGSPSEQQQGLDVGKEVLASPSTPVRAKSPFGV